MRQSYEELREYDRKGKTMIVASILVLVGFVLLVKGADVLVDGACSIAKRCNVSDLVVGLTIVALGTSTPELVVTIISVLKGSSGIALGNVLGSNIANLCLILGIAGVLSPIAIRKSTVWREIPFCLGIAVLLLFVVAFHNLSFLISRKEAFLLLGGFVAYMVFMLSSAKELPIGVVEPSAGKPIVAVLMILGGLGGLIIGGELIVRSCVNIAIGLGVSEALIGVTIVAIGTSLPELTTSIVAVLKGKPNIAVGTVVGSNILNTCLVLGTAAAIRPIAATGSFVMDAWTAAIASLMLFFFMFTGKRQKLDRWEALLFLAVYVGYIGYAIYRR